MKQSISFLIDCYAPSLLRLALPLIARVTLSRQTIDFLERLAIPELEDENPSRQKQGDTIREAQRPIMIDEGIGTPQHNARD
jgi:hypothetical protein